MRSTLVLKWLWGMSLVAGVLWLNIGRIGRSAFIMAWILISLYIFRRFVLRNIWWLWVPMTPILWSSWTALVLPTATLHYPKNAEHDLRYIWNVQHRIYKGKLSPGASSSDEGFLFPNHDFFMRIDWAGGGNRGCAIITPTWKGTDIYLDENGDFDRSEGNLTDWKYLRPCPEEYLLSP